MIAFQAFSVFAGNSHLFALVPVGSPAEVLAAGDAAYRGVFCRHLEAETAALPGVAELLSERRRWTAELASATAKEKEATAAAAKVSADRALNAYPTSHPNKAIIQSAGPTPDESRQAFLIARSSVNAARQQLQYIDGKINVLLAPATERAHLRALAELKDLLASGSELFFASNSKLLTELAALDNALANQGKLRPTQVAALEMLATASDGV